MTPRDLYPTKCSKEQREKRDNDPKTATLSTSLCFSWNVTKDGETLLMVVFYGPNNKTWFYVSICFQQGKHTEMTTIVHQY